MEKFDSYLWRAMNSVASWATAVVQEETSAKFAIQVYVRDHDGSGKEVRYFPCFYPPDWNGETLENLRKLLRTYFSKHPAFHQRFTSDLKRLLWGVHGWGLPAVLQFQLPADSRPLPPELLDKLPAELCLAAASGVDASNAEEKGPSRPAALRALLTEGLKGKEAIGVVIEIISFWELLGLGNRQQLEAWLSNVERALRYHEKPDVPKTLGNWKRSEFRLLVRPVGSLLSHPAHVCILGIVFDKDDPMRAAIGLFNGARSILEQSISASLLAIDVLRSFSSDLGGVVLADAPWHENLLGLAREFHKNVGATFLVHQQLERSIAAKKEYERTRKRSTPFHKGGAQTVIWLTARLHAADLESGWALEYSAGTVYGRGSNKSPVEPLFKSLEQRAARLSSAGWLKEALLHMETFKQCAHPGETLKKELEAFAKRPDAPIAVLPSQEMDRWRIIYRDHPLWPASPPDFRWFDDRVIQVQQT